jgi:hypothetical protein
VFEDEKVRLAFVFASEAEEVRVPVLEIALYLFAGDKLDANGARSLDEVLKILHLFKGLGGGFGLGQ